MARDVIVTKNPVNYTARDGEAVTPSDSTIVSYNTGLRVGTGGNVNVQMVDSESTLLHVNVQDGEWMPIAVKRVLATDTTATNINGYF